MRCECAADGLQQRGERMRMRCLQIADTWRTDCNNATFKKQKPYFCNSKTPFLHVNIIIKLYLIENKEVTLLV